MHGLLGSLILLPSNFLASSLGLCALGFEGLSGVGS